MTTTPAHPVPFIVGSPRSGTTLLRAMLEAHPSLGIPGESHFIPRLRATRRRYERGDLFDAPRFVDDLARDRYFAAWGIPRREHLAAVTAAGPATLEQALRATYLAYAHRHGKRRWGDKTPSYVLHVRTIARMFPEARFLHLIRDGRDVAASLLDLGWASSVEDAALRWAFRVRRGRARGRALGPERYREIRYEDLIARPGATLREACEFLDLAFDERMTQPQRGASSVLATLTNPENHQRLHRAPGVVRDWREDLAGPQVARFEAIAGDLLSALGYPRATTRSSVPTRLGAAARRIASLPKRLGARARRMTWSA